MISVTGNNMNVFLNVNWRDVMKDMKPSYEKTLGTAFSRVLKQLLMKVPYNQIFKD